MNLSVDSESSIELSDSELESLGCSTGEGYTVEGSTVKTSTVESSTVKTNTVHEMLCPPEERSSDAGSAQCVEPSVPDGAGEVCGFGERSSDAGSAQCVEPLVPDGAGGAREFGELLRARFASLAGATPVVSLSAAGMEVLEVCVTFCSFLSKHGPVSV